MKLSVNQLIKWNSLDSDGKDSSCIERVISIDESGTDIAAINVDAKRSQPVWYKYADVIDAIRSGEACVLHVDHRKPLCLTSDDLQDAKNKNICRVRDKRWEVIEPLVTGPNAFAILFSPERARLVAERTKVEFEHCKNGATLTYSRQSIYAFLYLWWQGGQTKDALFARYGKCGARGKPRIQAKADSKKLGRPSRITKLTEVLTGVALTLHWLDIIHLGAALFLDSEKVRDIAAAYRRTLALFCPKGKVQNERGEWEWEIPDYTKGEVFSPEQFRYHVLKKKDQNLEAFFKKRFSKKKFNTKYRANKSNSTRQAPYPGALYQIDATIADDYLVSRLIRLHIIGRPVIIAIIDVFSRMIVGICVRPEREKWTVINLALMNAIEDKVAFCRKYGIDIKTEDWPVVGLPDGITGDRGTMISYNSDNLTNGLSMAVSNTPAFRPDWKGIIEQLFRQLNIRIIQYLPGAVDKKRERGDRDVRLDAALDIDQFVKIIIKAVLYHNNCHYQKDYPMTEEMIKAGVRPIAREIYNWGRDNLSGRPRIRDQESIYTHLLPCDEARMTPLGIKFRGELYTCEQAETEGWRFRAKNLKNWKIPVGFDPRLPGYIYIRSGDGSPSIRCHLMHPDDSIAAKYDLAEIDVYREHKLMADQQEQVPDMQARVNMELDLESISAEAKAMLAQARVESPPQSNQARVEGINEHMKTEAFAMDEEYRQEMSERLGLPTGDEAGATFSDEDNDEYVPRSGFSNVLSIQERMSK
jgi:putative transposase